MVESGRGKPGNGSRISNWARERDVAVHKFICAGTLEENIDEIIERKKIIAASAVSAGEGWLTELSTNELRNIFSLRLSSAWRVVA